MPSSGLRVNSSGQFRQGDPEWTRLRKRALDDLYWFAANVLDYGDRIPMRKGPHALLCKFAERKTGVPQLDNAPYQKIEMPRETGKTTLLTEALTIQDICRNPNISIMLVNEKEQTARDFLSEIKHQLTNNEFLRALFPEIIPKDLNDTTWSGARIIVNRTSGRKEPTVFVIGEGGTVTGLHPDHIRCDDIISREAMENARAGSWQIMHQVNRWNHQLVPLLNSNAEPFPSILWLGTRWYHNDCYEHVETAFGYGEEKQAFLLKMKLENGETQQVTAWRVGDLAIFRRAAIEDGRSIFPEKWDLDKLAKIRLRDEGLFACNYMNQPSDDVTAVFKDTWLQTYDWLDEQTLRFTDGSGAKKTHAIQDLDVVGFVDPGGFAVRQIEDRAQAAMVFTGSTAHGQHIVLDSYSGRDTFLTAIRTIVDKVRRYRPRKLCVEQVAQQGSFLELLRRALADANLVVTVEPVKPGNRLKEQRILLLEPYFQRGQIFIGKGPGFHQFRTQFAQFPRAARLDELDALAYGPEVWKKQPMTARSQQQRQETERQQYYMKRGLRPAFSEPIPPPIRKV